MIATWPHYESDTLNHWLTTSCSFYINTVLVSNVLVSSRPTCCCCCCCCYCCCSLFRVKLTKNVTKESTSVAVFFFEPNSCFDTLHLDSVQVWRVHIQLYVILHVAGCDKCFFWNTCTFLYHLMLYLTALKLLQFD